MLKAFLFDLDGVLVPAGDWHYEALNRSLKQHGQAIIGPLEHKTVYNGLPTRTKLIKLGIPDDLHKPINELKQILTKATIRKRCKIDKKRLKLITQLKQDGYKLACCSNSIRDSIEEMLKLSGIIDYFDVIIGNDQIAKPKPDPAIYFEAMTQLEVKPTECVIVEDSEYGIQAATATGAYVWKVDDIKDVTYTTAKGVVDDFTRSASRVTK